MPLPEEIVSELVARAEALLGGGTLAFPPGGRVAYAFVAPIELRDDLADVLGDVALHLSEDAP